jgi:hypothetical protein
MTSRLFPGPAGFLTSVTLENQMLLAAKSLGRPSNALFLRSMNRLRVLFSEIGRFMTEPLAMTSMRSGLFNDWHRLK